MQRVTNAVAGVVVAIVVTCGPAGAQSRVGQLVSTASSGSVDTAALMALQASSDAANAGKVRVPRQAPRLRPVLPKQASGVPDTTVYPPTPVAAETGLRIAQTATTNFLGANLSDAFVYPPDSMGAVGPTQFVVAINNRFRTFSKTSGSPDGVLDVSSDVFWQGAMTPPIANNFTSDPRVRYDRLTDRWYVIMIDVPGGSGTLPNRVMIAVSDGGVITPATIWTFFWFLGDGSNFTDYPTLGLDANALYIGANMFSTAGPFVGTNAYVVQKASLLGGGPPVVNKFTAWANTCPGPDGMYTPQGVDNTDPLATTGYFVGVSGCFFGTLFLQRVSNPASTAPTLSAPIAVSVSATAYPPNFSVPHLGNAGGINGQLDAIDDRLYAAQIRGGQLWTAHNIGVNSSGVASSPDRTGIRWYQIGSLGATPSVTQSGTVYDNVALASARQHWMPSINVTGQGHAALGFSTAGTGFRANAAFAGRLSGDALGAMQAVTLLTNTSASYNTGVGVPQRWGDYSYTSIDPSDDMTLWTIQEYADGTDSWGVRVAKLAAPPPATPVSASPSSVDANLASVAVTITGTSSGGSGFFDPGAGFANRPEVVIPGVTVRSVAVTSPTTIDVSLNTRGAPAGAVPITVINPDGQSRSGGTLTINATGAPIITSTDSVTCSVGAACNFTATATGTPAPTFSATGALPSGIAAMTTGGVLAGTPAAGTQGTYTLTITAANGHAPDATQTFKLIVVASCGGFTDVPLNANYCNEAEFLRNRGITLGCGATTYCPNDSVTRGAMALFMKRLADVMQPVVNELQQSPGALDLDISPTICRTGDIVPPPPLPPNYPRIVVVNWAFSGKSTGAFTARGSIVGSRNGGATYPVGLDTSVVRTSAGAIDQWVNMNGNSVYAIPAGETIRFALRLDREAGSGPGSVSASTCQLQLTVFSQTGVSSPFDSRP